MSGRRRDLALTAALALLAALYLWWFRADAHRLASWLVFAAPPLLLAIGTARGRPLARFWAGVLALMWFSHGVMSAWTAPAHAALAWTELLLALLVIALVSVPGLRARRAARRAAARGQ